MRLNGKHCYTFHNWHGDTDLTPMLAYKFFEKFATHDTHKHIKLNINVPRVKMNTRDGNYVYLSSGQKLNPSFYDYYCLRYPPAELRSAGDNWPVLWVQDDTIKGFVCPIQKGVDNDE